MFSNRPVVIYSKQLRVRGFYNNKRGSIVFHLFRHQDTNVEHYL